MHLRSAHAHLAIASQFESARHQRGVSDRRSDESSARAPRKRLTGGTPRKTPAPCQACVAASRAAGRPRRRRRCARWRPPRCSTAAVRPRRASVSVWCAGADGGRRESAEARVRAVRGANGCASCISTTPRCNARPASSPRAAEAVLIHRAPPDPRRDPIRDRNGRPRRSRPCACGQVNAAAMFSQKTYVRA